MAIRRTFFDVTVKKPSVHRRRRIQQLGKSGQEPTGSKRGSTDNHVPEQNPKPKTRQKSFKGGKKAR